MPQNQCIWKFRILSFNCFGDYFAHYMLAQKIQVAYPNFACGCRAFDKFYSSVPVIRIEPELIFLIFLPHYCTKQLGHLLKNCGVGEESFSSSLIIGIFHCIFSCYFLLIISSGYCFGVGVFIRRNRFSTDTSRRRTNFKICKSTKTFSLYFRRRKFVKWRFIVSNFFDLRDCCCDYSQFVWHEAAGKFHMDVYWRCRNRINYQLTFFKNPQILPTDSNTDVLLYVHRSFLHMLLAGRVASGV